MDTKPIGYKAISEKLKIKTLPHYHESYIARAGRGKTLLENHRVIDIYPKNYALRNEDDLLENLEFALKYDGVNLNIIKALFENIEKKELIKFIKQQHTGIYSRKIWYFYEFLMRDRLDIKNLERVKYVNLLDPKKYFTCDAIKSSRHAINNNLLGNNEFCPFVRRTELLEKYINRQLNEKANLLLKKYEPHLIARAINYLYTKETMSSYQIEREQPDKSRTARFVHMLQQAAKIKHFSKEQLIELQNIIVDPRFQDRDYRHTQNYVGENVTPYLQKIHYISPKPEDVNELMEGLLGATERMLATGVHPVIIAAVFAFGFVFIHPFEDGNGRIHRFLIHAILSITNFTPKDMIFPVSSVMLKHMHDYDEVLETFSKPLLTVLTDYFLSNDGVLEVKQESKSFYQYMDFTRMAEYLFSCVDEAIEKDFAQELQFIANYDKTKRAIQNIVDMPDNQIDLFIKCVMQNNGELSAEKRKKFFSLLTKDEILVLEKIIRDVMMNAN